MKKQLFVLAASLALSAGALAQVGVAAPWVRATVPQQKSTGVFMQLQSAQDARLVEARTPVAGRVELHRMEMRGQTVRMQQIDGIDLPAGKEVNLASGGYHLMLMDLKRQLKPDEMVPLTIVVEGKDKKRETITFDAPVKPLTFSEGAMPRHH